MQFFVSIIVRIIFCTIEMECDVLTEQRINIKFLVKLGKNGPEIREMLQSVYVESTMKRSKKMHKSHSKIKTMLILFFFLTFVECTMNFQRVRQLMLHFMRKFLKTFTWPCTACATWIVDEKRTGSRQCVLAYGVHCVWIYC